MLDNLGFYIIVRNAQPNAAKFSLAIALYNTVSYAHRDQ